MCTWERHDPDRYRPVAAPLDQYVELFGVDLAPIHRIAANIEPYIRADTTSVWSLAQLERQLDPDAFGPRWNGGYLTHRRPVTANP